MGNVKCANRVGLVAQDDLHLSPSEYGKTQVSARRTGVTSSNIQETGAKPGHRELDLGVRPVCKGGERRRWRSRVENRVAGCGSPRLCKIGRGGVGHGHKPNGENQNPHPNVASRVRLGSDYFRDVRVGHPASLQHPHSKFRREREL